MWSNDRLDKIRKELKIPESWNDDELVRALNKDGTKLNKTRGNDLKDKEIMSLKDELKDRDNTIEELRQKIGQEPR